MAGRRFLTPIVAALWVITSSPYFSVALLSLHAQHRIHSEVNSGVLGLILHHDLSGAEEDHRCNRSADQSEQTADGERDHETAIAPDVVTITASNGKILSSVVPVIFFCNIIPSLNRLLTFGATLIPPGKWLDRIPISSPPALRTVVLLI